jgi:hypothetical protein
MSRPSDQFPKARETRLIVEPVDAEAVIYDLDTSVAHALQPLAAAVFADADGTRSLDTLAQLATKRLQRTVTAAEVRVAVEQLAALGLITAAAETQPGAAASELSRRDALKAFAAAGAGALLVSSVAAPGALAQSQGLTCAAGAPDTATAPSFPDPWGGRFDSDTSEHTVSSFGITYATFEGTAIMYLLPSASQFEGYAPSITTSNNAGCYYMIGSAYTYWSGGEWQCVPCDAGNGQTCCQVVCAGGATPVGQLFYAPSSPSGALHTSGGYYGLYCGS